MVKIKADIDHREDEQIARDYWCVSDDTGKLRCSCGGELIKMDEYTYRCIHGYPIYTIDNATLFIDKFGNIRLKNIPHGDEEEKKKGGKKNGGKQK